MNILLSYYSRTGITKAVANEIAGRCKADLQPILDVRGNGKGVGYLRSLTEAVLHMQAPIRSMEHTPDHYDLLIIGTPIWGWNVPAPVRSYISTCRRQIRHVAFFCTYGGAGQHKVLRDLASITGQSAVATLALRDQQIEEDKIHIPLSEFLDRINNPDAVNQAPEAAKTWPDFQNG